MRREHGVLKPVPGHHPVGTLGVAEKSPWGVRYHLPSQGRGAGDFVILVQFEPSDHHSVVKFDIFLIGYCKRNEIERLMIGRYTRVPPSLANQRLWKISESYHLS